MPISLEDGQGDIAYVPDVAVQSEVFQQIMFAQAVVPRDRFIDCPIADNDVAASLDEKTERVRSARPVRERPVQHHQNKASAKRRKEKGQASR